MELDALAPAPGRLAELHAAIRAVGDCGPAETAAVLADWCHLASTDPHPSRRDLAARLIADHAGTTPGAVLSHIDAFVAERAWSLKGPPS